MVVVAPWTGQTGQTGEAGEAGEPAAPTAGDHDVTMPIPRRASPSTVILLGPQGGTPDVDMVLAEHGLRRKVALVMAGYQEREDDDGALAAAVGVPLVNLRLHARAREVFAVDGAYTEAYRARQQHLRHMQSFYRVRLDKLEEAARMIAVRHVDPELLEHEAQVSVNQLRQIDLDHAAKCGELRAVFDARWGEAERAATARHRAELAEALAGAQALLIAGGHVASLLNRLRLFGLLELAAHLPVIAWSAGAMVLTERIVLFHDYPPYGSDVAQVLDLGFGLAPGFVVLPDPERRIRLDARDGIARFARRMAPATCVAMARGARLVFERGELTRAVAMRMTRAGDVERGWTGGAS